MIMIILHYWTHDNSPDPTDGSKWWLNSHRLLALEVFAEDCQRRRNSSGKDPNMVSFMFYFYWTQVRLLYCLVFHRVTAVRRHCTDWYEIWALTEHEIYYIKIELDLRKFSIRPFSETEKGFGVNPTPGGSKCTGLHPLFHESDIAPLFHLLLALSLKETTLSGWRWFHKISQNPSNHAHVHDIQLGKGKFTFPAKEATFPAIFVNSFILLFDC